VGNALHNQCARYLKKKGKRATPDVSVTNSHVVRHRSGCRSGSWEELMGRAADVYRPTPHDDPRSYGEGDSEVRAIRRVTGALHRQLRGNKTRGGAISQEATRRFVASSRAASRSRLVPRQPERLRMA
jgi:hypothetical protein